MAIKRTYIRAVIVGSVECVFELPEWKPGVWITLSKWSVPPHERGHLHPGFRCNVDIDIDAKNAEELNICKWGLE